MKTCLALVMVLAVCRLALAAPEADALPEGVWFPPDRNAAVEIARCGAALCGRIVWIDESRPPPGVSGPPIDLHNPDPALRQRRLCGLEILRDFKADESGSWAGGTIYNPKDGQDWHAEMTMAEPTVLNLRGYVLIPLFGQTQIWTRALPSFTERCAGP